MLCIHIPVTDCTWCVSACTVYASIRDFSFLGAVLEHIEEFMRKWQTSTKGHS